MGTRQSEKPVRAKKKNDDQSSEASTRTQRATTKGKKRSKTQRKPHRRIFPIWLRIIVVLLLAAGALVVGAMIGYGVLGDGLARDVFKAETWQHIIDIVTKRK